MQATLTNSTNGFRNHDTRIKIGESLMSLSLADVLLQTIEGAVGLLRQLTDEETSQHLSEGKWSKKEILGHLIDSASNNHQRFVRAQLVDEFEFPGYDQPNWVLLQHYNEVPWENLVELWYRYNRHLAHIIRFIPENQLSVSCKIGAKPPVTLRSIVEDYPVHMRHHIDQIVGEETTG